ncbi:MAG TPA: ABC transporter ATP-binding protein [Bdellovibrio sp.]|nr:ABC transporter ATP-binding protein [Bdellovibrio sp.]
MSKSTPQSFIEVIDFQKSFDHKKVHDGVSFYVRKGECLGLIGGSGTGKSVLLRSLVGLEKPDRGQILIDGEDIVNKNERELIDVRKKIAYAFQDGALFDSMTVYENLAYPLREHTHFSEKEIAQQIRDQLEEFGLDASAEKLFPASLSGGMQKRVGLARAMMMHPQVVLYDEPTAGLDPYNTKRIQESILKMKAKGVTSILVTHDMPTVYAVCDKVALLLNGRIGEEYTIDKLAKESTGPMFEFINGERA